MEEREKNEHATVADSHVACKCSAVTNTLAWYLKTYNVRGGSSVVEPSTP
jgi:hypothetical protein